MSRLVRAMISAGLVTVLLSAGATAQLLPGVSVQVPLPSVGGVPVVGPVIDRVTDPVQVQETQQIIRPTLDRVSGLPRPIAESGSSRLLELRRLRLEALLREYPQFLEWGNDGQPVRRGVLLAIDPDPLSLQLAARAGYRAVADDRVTTLGLRTVTLAVPAGTSARSAMKRLRRVAPRLVVDFDHLYEPAGGSLAPLNASLAAAAGAGAGRTIGMVDGGVAAHPAFAGARIEQSGFAGEAQPTGHGTAVASLLIGNQGRFRGAATGAQLYVADVYGGNRAAGSASAIVRALGWLAAHRPDVINISLAGPQNAAVSRAVQILQSRGIQIVAAVGNDGPAAPPQYPASQDGVIAVTAVDSKGRALPEAGRTKSLDFAAPGADMAAATPGKGYSAVRGTSFAAPFVAARLAALRSTARLAAEATPGKGKVGRGIVCRDCPVQPQAVGAK